MRDTLILPCRHLCLCNTCADNLWYQANNCPICRAPFRALLQIRAMRKKLPTLPQPGAQVCCRYLLVNTSGCVDLQNEGSRWEHRHNVWGSLRLTSDLDKVNEAGLVLHCTLACQITQGGCCSKPSKVINNYLWRGWNVLRKFYHLAQCRNDL